MEIKVTTGVLTKQYTSKKIWAFYVNNAMVEFPLKNAPIKFVKRLQISTDLNQTFYEVKSPFILKIFYIMTSFGKPVQHKAFYFSIREDYPEIELRLGDIVAFQGQAELIEDKSSELGEVGIMCIKQPPKRKKAILIQQEEANV